MATSLREKIDKILDAPIDGHPSRVEKIKIDRMIKAIKLLAADASQARQY